MALRDQAAYPCSCVVQEVASQQILRKTLVALKRQVTGRIESLREGDTGARPG